MSMSLPTGPTMDSLPPLASAVAWNLDSLLALMSRVISCRHGPHHHATF